MEEHKSQVMNVYGCYDVYTSGAGLSSSTYSLNAATSSSFSTIIHTSCGKNDTWSHLSYDEMVHLQEVNNICALKVIITVYMHQGKTSLMSVHINSILWL